MKEYELLFRTLILTSLMIVSFSACNKNSLRNCDEHSVSFCSEDPTKTNIRIKNNSKYDFCNVVVNPFSEPVNCGIVKKGEMTCYRSFDTAYNYAYIQIFIDDKEFKLQPIDYVGEQPLGIGNFTYILDISDYSAGKVSITLQKD
jgi:hypothetical protein